MVFLDDNLLQQNVNPHI